MSRKHSHKFSGRTRLLTIAVAGCFAAAPAWSLPTGAAVANGTAGMSQAGNVLTVTNSNGAILNWQQFNIAAGETTRFLQTSASSSVLNRVVGGNLSAIYGTLSSNGRVWLVNPAGLLVGASGVIDTAGFVASTLGVRDSDFLAGRLTFSGPGGNLVNQGTITTPAGGSVYLIGANVSNAGVINTPKGEAILAAGESVALIDTATPGVKVEITGSQGNTTNLGTVMAEAGRIGMAGVIVRNSGTLNASGAVEEGGRVFLKASQDAYVDGSGRIVATGTKGGSIDVLGNRVAVMDNASIDASGAGAGGTVRVGGDLHGANPDIQNAQITYFGPGASIKADATKVGDGGTVIVWADDTTRAYGNISARGGASGGNGGFVETSGHNYLDFHATVDTRAPKGQAGTLLLDPADIIISTAADNTYGGSFSGGVFSGPALGPSNISWNTINTQLGGGNVVITTTGSQTGANGDITINASPGLSNISIYHPWLSGGGFYGGPSTGVGYSSSNNLSLLAYGAVNINAAFGNAGSGAINIYAGWNGSSTSTPAVNSTYNASQSIYFNSGGFIVSNGDVTLKTAGDINIVPTTAGSGAGIQMNAGTLTVNTMGLFLTGNDRAGAAIETNGNQVFNLSGGMALTGSSSGYGGYAGIRQYGTTTGQIFNIYGGGTATLQGGSGNGAMPANYFNDNCASSNGVAGSSCTGNWVDVANSGTAGQTFNFVSGGSLNVYGGSAGNNFAFIENAAGTQTINGSPNILVKGGSAGGVTVSGNVLSTGASISSDTGQVIYGGTITLDGNTTTATGAGAWIGSDSSQTIVATGAIFLTGGSGGSDNGAGIGAHGTQIITTTGSGGIALGGNGATGGGYDDFAMIRQNSASGSQTLSLYGGALLLQGGAGNGTGGTAFHGSGTSCGPIGSSPCDGHSSYNSAVIYNAGSGGQTISFTNSGGSIDLWAGNSGNGNFAVIRNNAGTQSITGSSSSYYPSISLIGGTSGGYWVVNPWGGSWLSNHASIFSLAGTQQINAAQISIDGGQGSAIAGAGILAIAGSQTINDTGTLSLTGGRGTNSHAAIRAWAGDQTVSASSMSLYGGSAGHDNGAYITTDNGIQSITTSGNINIYGGGSGASNYNNVAEVNQLSSVGSQTIVANGNINITGGSGGHDNDAVIYAYGGQSITTSGNINIYGGGTAGSYDNYAGIQHGDWNGTTNSGSGNQTITLATAGSSIVMYGGAGTGSGGTDSSCSPTACPTSSNWAGIENNYGYSTIGFTGAGNSISITGGGAAGDYGYNSAGIENKGSGALTIGSTSSRPNITLTGGSAGGWLGFDYQGKTDPIDNAAFIGSNNGGGAVVIYGGAIALNGGSANYGGAFIGGTNVTVDTSGNLTIAGGTSTTNTPYPWVGSAAGIGKGEQAATVNLNVGGNLVMTSGSNGSASATLIGSLYDVATVKAHVYGDATLSGNASPVAMGSIAAGSYGGADVMLFVDGNIALTGSTTSTNGGVYVGGIRDNLAPATPTLVAGKNLTLTGNTGGVYVGVYNSTGNTNDSVDLWAGTTPSCTSSFTNCTPTASPYGGNLALSKTWVDTGSGSGANVSVTMGAYGSGAYGSIGLTDAMVATDGTLSAMAQNNLTLTDQSWYNNTSGMLATRLFSHGDQTITVGNTLTIQGATSTSYGSAGLASDANQTIQAKQINLYGGGTGASNTHDAIASIFAYGGQAITAAYGGAGGITITGGGATGGYNDAAGIQHGDWNSGSGNQTITLATAGSSIVMYGGAGNGTGSTNSWCTSLGYSAGLCYESANFAGIENNYGNQAITFNGSGGTLALYGGSAGYNNGARISHKSTSGTQSIQGTGLNLLLIGGTGGRAQLGSMLNDTDVTFDNEALIESKAAQSIGSSGSRVGSITITGGGNSASYGGAAIVADTTQAIYTSGNVVLTGGLGTGGNMSTGVLVTPAVIGGKDNNSVTLDISGGSLSVTGGSGAGSSAMVGSLLGPSSITVNAYGGITVGSSVPGTSFGAIGIWKGGTGSLTLNATGAGAGITLNAGSAIGGTDTVQMTSSSGSVTQAASPYSSIMTGGLSVSTGGGAISLLGNNVVDSVDVSGAAGFSLKTLTPVDVTLEGNTSGNLNITTADSATHGAIGVTKLGNLTLTSSDQITSTYGGNITVSASGGSLTVSSGTPLSTAGSIALDAGQAINIASTGRVVAATGDISLTAPTVNVSSTANPAVQAGYSLDVTATTLNVSGGGISDGNMVAGGDLTATVAGTATIGNYDFTALRGHNVDVTANTLKMYTGGLFATNDITVNAGNITATANSLISAGNDVLITSLGSIRFNDYTHVYAGNDVFLTLGSANSVLYLNESGTGMSPSSVTAGLPTTTYVKFLGRAAGGIVIDGVETTTTLAGGSGFYHYVAGYSVPAALNDGLVVTYALDICTQIPDLCKPPPKPPTNQDTCALNPGSCMPPGGDGGKKYLADDKGIGGKKDEFGEKKDEDKDKDKQSDNKEGGKKDDSSSGKKRVAQCT